MQMPCQVQRAYMGVRNQNTCTHYEVIDVHDH